MKLKSVSGITCYVKDLTRTIEFYEGLGFYFRAKDESHATGYINWFWIDFVSIPHENKKEFQEEAHTEKKGAGIYVYLSVDDVDAIHRELIEKGYKPSTVPRDWPWGNREFVLKDPDGYKLVFFKKK